MFLLGESLGGAIVVQLAADSPPRGLILQSTFSSLRDVANVHYPKLSWLVPLTKLDSVSQIVRYGGPLLQSHGNADRTIPFSLGPFPNPWFFHTAAAPLLESLLVGHVCSLR